MSVARSRRVSICCAVVMTTMTWGRVTTIRSQAAATWATRMTGRGARCADDASASASGSATVIALGFAMNFLVAVFTDGSCSRSM